MEKWMNLIAGVIEDFWGEIVLAILVLSLLLMIIMLKSVRKNTRLVKKVDERTKEVMKLSMEQIRNESKREVKAAEIREKQPENKLKKQEEEELFGSVIQEIFS
ncbi:Uncharacterised protein [uncultured Roseburia sp.]|uniref:ATP synthase F0 subunit 8 n=1 Tax=Brotonthovivens ammoniilytica TaxID=2981725 RepID=A0ABT2TI68_9FIRM|nr:hypothetical protein [Brotonthovivens ammoniilytica]MCU6761905.1 hypothetical protein [Brotonthovivens ammoniilytica]SCI50239.1 Uncharacterised protein [uncultured Roseburia sp.]